VPPKTRDGPMRVPVVKEKDNFFRNAETFDGAAGDSGRLDQVGFYVISA